MPVSVGRLQSLDWTGGLDRWTGLDWTGLDWTGLDSTRLKVSATILQLLESGYLLTYLCNFTQYTIAKLCVSVPLGTGQSSHAYIMRQDATINWYGACLQQGTVT